MCAQCIAGCFCDMHTRLFSLGAARFNNCLQHRPPAASSGSDGGSPSGARGLTPNSPPCQQPSGSVYVTSRPRSGSPLEAGYSGGSPTRLRYTYSRSPRGATSPRQQHPSQFIHVEHATKDQVDQVGGARRAWGSSISEREQRRCACCKLCQQRQRSGRPGSTCAGAHVLTAVQWRIACCARLLRRMMCALSTSSRMSGSGRCRCERACWQRWISWRRCWHASRRSMRRTSGVWECIWEWRRQGAKGAWRKQQAWCGACSRSDSCSLLLFANTALPPLAVCWRCSWRKHGCRRQMPSVPAPTRAIQVLAAGGELGSAQCCTTCAEVFSTSLMERGCVGPPTSTMPSTQGFVGIIPAAQGLLAGERLFGHCAGGGHFAGGSAGASLRWAAPCIPIHTGAAVTGQRHHRHAPCAHPAGASALPAATNGQ